MTDYKVSKSNFAVYLRRVGSSHLEEAKELALALQDYINEGCELPEGLAVDNVSQLLAMVALRSSTVLTISVSEEDCAKLEAAFELGALDDLGVSKIDRV